MVQPALLIPTMHLSLMLRTLPYMYEMIYPAHGKKMAGRGVTPIKDMQHANAASHSEGHAQAAEYKQVKMCRVDDRCGDCLQRRGNNRSPQAMHSNLHLLLGNLLALFNEAYCVWHLHRRHEYSE